MTSIKPPGPSGVRTPPESPSGATETRGTSEAFQEKLQGASRASANPTPASAPAKESERTQGTRAVVEDLRAGRLTPQQAVQRLTEQALARSGAPAALRPVIEARVQNLLRQDPLLRDLVGKLGVTPDAEP